MRVLFSLALTSCGGRLMLAAFQRIAFVLVIFYIVSSERRRVIRVRKRGCAKSMKAEIGYIAAIRC